MKPSGRVLWGCQVCMCTLWGKRSGRQEVNFYILCAINAFTKQLNSKKWVWVQQLSARLKASHPGANVFGAFMTGTLKAAGICAKIKVVLQPPSKWPWKYKSWIKCADLKLVHVSVKLGLKTRLLNVNLHEVRSVERIIYLSVTVQKVGALRGALTDLQSALCQMSPWP